MIIHNERFGRDTRSAAALLRKYKKELEGESK